jgi:hypothetical protein
MTNQLVTLAKAFLMSSQITQGHHETSTLIRQFAKLQGHEVIQEVVINAAVDPEPYLSGAAGYLSCELALSQALWELVHLGYFMYQGSPRTQQVSQPWTSIFEQSGGTRASWHFEDLGYAVPGRVFVTPFWRYNTADAITDPDLFILESGMQGADPEIVEALRDAVLCLRHGLYRPAVTMLGKAMEGAWIEFGVALLAAVRDDTGFDHDDFSEMIEGDSSIAKKITEVFDLYGSKNALNHVVKASKIRPVELKSAVIWSDVVREARNSIHFGVKPTMANSYEKVVALFLEGSRSLGLLYKITNVADNEE